ncbi:type III-A CRISPR-associated protein Csm2 [Thermocrinis jamiesonii]|jgi:CRISPR-associated protein, Csm2 family|uniref:type III-A CRISPR-associated protein Csm2 n=1 Tax=Thermocrinis jamiesonii TaxID=1302351 RepID=UPI0004954020|nr:type III-A CRISPR-associated protein Csm2 [Thermocrinis jamiesonii]
MSRNNPQQNRQKNNDKESENVKKLKEKLSNESIAEFSEKDIFHPEEGYVKKAIEDINITAVQLRKVFQEFKAIRDGLKKDENVEEALKKLYKLYAILEYQAKRGVLDKDFKELMFRLFDNIERNKSKKAFEKAYDLLMAMVAYSKKS